MGRNPQWTVLARFSVGDHPPVSAETEDENSRNHRTVKWLVVSIPLKNISQLGWLSPIYRKIKNVPNHQPVKHVKGKQSRTSSASTWSSLWKIVRSNLYGISGYLKIPQVQKDRKGCLKRVGIWLFPSVSFGGRMVTLRHFEAWGLQTTVNQSPPVHFGPWLAILITIVHTTCRVHLMSFLALNLSPSYKKHLNVI